MNLREEFQRAQAEARATRVIKDQKTLNDVMATMAKNLPVAVRNIIAAVRADRDFSELERDTLRKGFTLNTVTAPEITLPLLQTLPGFRALHAACGSDDADLRLAIDVTRSGNNTWVQIEIDPRRPFQESVFKQGSGDNGLRLNGRLPPLPEDDLKPAPARLNL